MTCFVDNNDVAMMALVLDFICPPILYFDNISLRKLFHFCTCGIGKVLLEDKQSLSMGYFDIVYL